MSRSWENVEDVVSWRLCLGCGACVAACPERALRLVDVETDGLRPQADSGRCAHCGTCLKVCPGVSLEAEVGDHRALPQLAAAWGTILEVWEGYAADPEIRFLGSSGGVATALALFCLERRHMEGVLHIGSSEGDPLVNVPAVSRNPAELLRRTGSRYAPAAPCLGLPSLDGGGAPYAFVGKPCDVAALRKWQVLREKAPGAVAVAISIFCAGTPSTQGTRRILEELVVKPEEVVEFRYRGCGWPGRTVVRTSVAARRERSMTYEESWGTILSKHTPFRCRLCPDSTGEFADISCGDPWYRQIEPNDPGRSLVLVRTDTGREILHEALQAGYVQLERAEPQTLPHSQRSLLQRRQHLWGRLLTLQMFGVPVPRYRGFSLFTNWRSLPVGSKMRSILGTARRLWTRKWNRPLKRHLHGRIS
jgi:coenzyme F420 hydrogenase subunit beta